MAQVFYNRFGNDAKKAEQEAKKLGYRIPSVEEVEIYRLTPREVMAGN